MNAPAIKERVATATVVDIHGQPDMSILSARRPAPPMPSDMFGSSWSLIVDLAEGCGSPVDYVAMGLIASCASLIGAKRRVRPFSTAEWREPSILWVAAVGDPSAHKSPALDAATAPLRLLEREYADDHKANLQAWDAQVERAKAELAAWSDMVKAATKDALGTPAKPDAAMIPDEPVRRRLLVQDATPEAMGALLAGNPQGTLHLRDELAGWLSSFDRYSPGGREFWLEAFGGRPHVIDRKGSKGPITIPFNGVSVLGGVQPDKLNSCLLNTPDDGLVARFLWCWPDPIPFNRPRAVANVGHLETIYRRLNGLGWGIGPNGEQAPITIPLADPAADLFEEWARTNGEGIEDFGALYKGFCGKMEGVVLRLALASALLAWADRGDAAPLTEIDARTTGAAIDFVESYAKPSALRVFGDAALPKVERDAAILGSYIQRNRLRRINARDLKRAPHKSALPIMRDGQSMAEAISYLVEADWLLPVGKREGSTVGRKSADFLVNPKVLEG